MVVPPSIGGAMASTTTTMRNSPANGIGPASAPRGRMGGLENNSNSSQPKAMTIPLSARKAQALDLSSVERRGQPTASREVPRVARPHGLQDAPTFRPTEDEFKNPMEYIRKIAPEGSKYGIVKIIPPDSWNPKFAIDTERFHFRTRRQELNMAEGGSRANLNYLDSLAKFHKQRNGTNLNRFPSVDKRPLDLYKLKKFVETKGGFENVCKHKRWAEIGRDLGYSGKIMSSLSTSLKNSYQKWLQPYEEWLRFNKPGVLQQHELENGGPFTPSPAATPVKRSNQNTPIKIASPAIRASTALHATLNEPPGTPPAAALASVPAELPRPPLSTGFTAVNAGGGFTAVNAQPPSSGFSAINAANGSHRPMETGQSTPMQSIESSMTSAKNTPDPKPSGFTPVQSFQNGHLKRQLSTDGESGPNGEADGSERRSKRRKNNNAPTVMGSQMTQPRLPVAPRLQPPRDRSNEKPGDRCEQCGKAEDDTAILLCDSCDAGYHRYCLQPPLKITPESDWHCPRCLVGTGEFGFEEGGVYSLRQFQEKARNFKDSYFRAKMPFDPILDSKRPVTEDDVEREFWRLAESITETVEVEYGADIHSTTHGSGFPTMEKHPGDPYAIDPWNLNVLPLDKESLFRHIKTDISGMTVPWLYVGMCFSTFCWHAEDHNTYSANYQHFGATKTWYGIPSEDAEKFEQAMRDTVPDLFETQPDLLYHLVTLLQPEKLKKAGVRVFALDQRAGQFVITFPKAYHAGFNHGFNFNEAVNFAPRDWEPYGEEGVMRLQQFRRAPVFSHDELLLTAASGCRETSIQTARWLSPALQRVLNRELAQREQFVAEHQRAKDGYATSQPGMPCDVGFVPCSEGVKDEDTACTYCKTLGYLSHFYCKKSGKVTCLLHAGKFECCEANADYRFAGAKAEHILYTRMTDDQLSNTVQKIVDISKTPETWSEKLDKLTCDDPAPALKNIKTLITEGERINQNYELPELPDLREWYERCNQWIEDANNYTVRKQQDRRKNGRAWRKSSTAKFQEAEDKERESRKLENIKALLQRADDLGFSAPEISTLRERAEKIEEFQSRVKVALTEPGGMQTEDLEALLEESRTFSVDIPEVDALSKLVKATKWFEREREHREHGCNLPDVVEAIQEGLDIGIPETHAAIQNYMDQRAAGEFWEGKVKELMAMEPINYQQLDALSKQASTIPVTRETLGALDAVLQKQRDAQEQIISLYERSKDPDLRQRPRYKEVREAMEALNELNSKPPGTIDLEKEQKRHEDWMRRGKKLFGKANAPLHILLQHTQLVEERNEGCLDLNDQPRMPVEPSSRANTPDVNDNVDGSGSSRDVFCICRRPEAGMMIECELCHEWYHGKCLKIARGKVKEDDKYTCPICDWRVKIPRDATRPKLEDLQAWQDEIPSLPFQPEEEDCLEKIIQKAADFRAFMVSFMNPMSTPDELPTQRFYLRKIEGADILLADETNFFRQELHKWAPVAPEPPPKLSVSLSTRKPRPTKQQKLMKEMGVDNPEDLPLEMRPKQGHKKKHGDQKPTFGKQSTFAPSYTPPGSPGPHHRASLGGASSTASKVEPPRTVHPTGFNFDPITSSAPTFVDGPSLSTSNGFNFGSPPPPTAGIDPNLEAMSFANAFQRSSSHGPDYDQVFSTFANPDEAAGQHATLPADDPLGFGNEDADPDTADGGHVADQFINDD